MNISPWALDRRSVVEDSECHKLEVPRIAKSGGSHDAYDTPNDHIDFAIGTTLQGIRNGLFRTGRSAPREIDRADYRILDFQLNHCAIDSEPAVSVMVDGLRMLLRRVDPGLEHFKERRDCRG